MNRFQLLAIGVMTVTTSVLAENTGDWVQLAKDHQSIVASIDGIEAFAAVSTVVFHDGDKEQRIGTLGWALTGTVSTKEVSTPFGPARMLEATYGKEGHPYAYTVRLKRLEKRETINLPSAKELLRNYEIMRPSSREPAKLFTLGKSPSNAIFGFTAKRDYGNFAVYNLYNDGSNEPKSITLDFNGRVVDIAGVTGGGPCGIVQSDTMGPH